MNGLKPLTMTATGPNPSPVRNRIGMKRIRRSCAANAAGWFRISLTATEEMVERGIPGFAAAFAAAFAEAAQ